MYVRSMLLLLVCSRHAAAAAAACMHEAHAFTGKAHKRQLMLQV